KEGYEPSLGARHLRRTIQEEIEDKVADFKLDHADVKNFIADLGNDEITFSAKEH
uniref:hypothetical protein n=1 Tax=Lactobacillus jensenii TaxID=109790 RepID=UPI0028700C4F